MARKVWGCRPLGEGFCGWRRGVEERGHSLVVTRGEEVPLLSYCLLCGKYAERTGQGLKEGCKGKPKNKMARFRLKKMMEGKHPEDGRCLGNRVAGGVLGGSVGSHGGVAGGHGSGEGLPWDAGGVQGCASGSGNVLAFLGPCGAGASGPDGFLGLGPCGAGASGPGSVARPCGASASGSRVGRSVGWADPCGAGASGAVGVWPWEPDSGHGEVQPEEEEVAREWWSVCDN